MTFLQSKGKAAALTIGETVGVNGGCEVVVSFDTERKNAECCWVSALEPFPFSALLSVPYCVDKMGLFCQPDNPSSFLERTLFSSLSPYKT
jgi:hypothetical protein